MVASIPEGFHTITPSLALADAAKAIDLYKKAFGAEEKGRAACPETGKIMHACLEIGSSKIFLNDAMPGMCTPTSANFYLYFDDVDAAFRQATSAGLQEVSPLQDMFWGDRMGSLKDPFGNNWTLATHIRDLSKEEMEKGRDQFVARMKAAKAA